MSIQSFFLDDVDTILDCTPIILSQLNMATWEWLALGRLKATFFLRGTKGNVFWFSQHVDMYVESKCPERRFHLIVQSSIVGGATRWREISHLILNFPRGDRHLLQAKPRRVNIALFCVWKIRTRKFDRGQKGGTKSVKSNICARTGGLPFLTLYSQVIAQKWTSLIYASLQQTRWTLLRQKTNICWPLFFFSWR
jgi:hypothetical protein